MTAPVVVVDANVLIAALIESDDHHAVCSAYVATLPPPILVSVLALTEVAHFLEKNLGPQAEVDLIRSVRDGDILPIYSGSSWEHIHDLANTYVSAKLGMVDASLFICAERSGSRTIASLDNLHRSIVTPRTDWFEVVPAQK